MANLMMADESYAIRGAVFEVHNQMGCGFLEAVYQECLENELTRRGIPFEAHKQLSVIYKDEPLNQIYKPDIVCYDKIIIELKAVRAIAAEHRAQLLNYLKLANMRLGFLINFASHPRATIERVVL